ncbi:uncharacterized protein si:dkey-261h17.1 [Neolamprologus brichardi]|uniref:Uncharacterized LOC102793364 n=1 Tax=Neolamprologus brichardi TaxID=32507 RepID=A0A3Q4GGG6_NEOBR|nr:uncharacterized protein si:dkey-261h17.1 [Neolamprologus brichardi]
MATSTWRMNGLYRKMTQPLFLCTLFLSSVVICQDQTTTPTTAPSVNNGTNETFIDSLITSLTKSLANNSELWLLTAEPQTDEDNSSNDNTMVDSTKGPSPSLDLSPSSSSSSSSSSSNSSVFVGLLVSGLLAALGITVGYCYCQRRTDTKAVKLTDETYPADQENQGSTLASVAPLIPTPETQEKPSVNGESPEAAKTQPPPPTNGHSTTKTADTEL